MTLAIPARLTTLAAAAAALLVLPGQRAEAALVTYSVSGTVIGATQSLNLNLAAGSPFSGVFTLDTSVQNTSGPQQVNTGGYADALTALSLSFGTGVGAFEAAAASGSIRTTRIVVQNGGYDELSLFLASGLSGVNGPMPTDISFNLQYVVGSLFADNDAVKAGIPDLPVSGLRTDDDWSRGSISFDQDRFIFYQFDTVRFVSSVSTVPTPSSLALVGGALLAWVGMARRRRHAASGATAAA